MPDEFKVTNKVITVAGRKLTVWKKTFQMQLDRFTMMEEAEKRMNGNANGHEGEGLAEIIKRGFARMTYPSLKACTTGKLFAEEECYKIEQDALDLWLTTARELNPDWFPVAGETTEQEIIEKKD